MERADPVPSESHTTVFVGAAQTIWGVDAQAHWERMRTGPAVVSDGGRVMVVSPTAVEAALHAPELFSSNPDAAYLGSDSGLIPLQVDPPEHVRFRRMLDPLYTPRKMAQLEGDVAALANRCIDGFIERGRCDFSTEFAVPIPSGTFLGLLGLPLDGLEEFIAVKDDMIRPQGDTPTEIDAKRAAAGAWVFEMFGEQLDRREREPSDDILGELVRRESEGELTREETLNICFLQLTAGLDTVTDTLECSLAFLAQHPEHQRMLAEDPGLVPGAVEELLRWETPVPGVARVAMADTELEGCPIKKGSQVGVLLATTNIDPDRFVEPSLVDFSRASNKHYSFGAGVHRCLGSHLARMELRVALREWHRRIPSYSLPEGHRLMYSQSLREIQHLPLEFTPGTREP